MNKLDEWVFNYSSLQGLWRAAKRENYKEIFNNNESVNVLRSSNIDTLVEIIMRTNGRTVEIDKLVKS